MIWLYPLNPSINNSNLWPNVESMNMSYCIEETHPLGKLYLSLENSRKIWFVHFFFFSGTMFANHVGCLIGLMYLAVISFSASPLIIFFMSRWKLFLICYTSSQFDQSFLRPIMSSHSRSDWSWFIYIFVYFPPP